MQSCLYFHLSSKVISVSPNLWC